MSVRVDAPYPNAGWRRAFFGVNPKITLVRVIVWEAIAILVFHQMLMPIKIIGPSMSPTYGNGSVNLINRVAYLTKAPSRGDVIALRDGDEILLKRIVGLPGEMVEIVNGAVVIDKKPLEDGFSKSLDDMKPIGLGFNEYFFIGDNREVSTFGKVTRNAIMGRIVF